MADKELQATKKSLAELIEHSLKIIKENSKKLCKFKKKIREYENYLRGGKRMATGFSVMDALNKNSKAGLEQSPTAKFRTKDISIFKMYRNGMNFYNVNNVKELAGDILMYGLKQNLEITYDPCELGEYRIVAGERRWEALKYLVSLGYKEFEIATSKLTTPQDADEEQVEIIIANSYRDKTVSDMIEEEQRLKTSLERMRAAGRQIKGYDLQTGRLRDIVASMLKVSKTKIAQIESVSNNLIPEFREELNKERLTFSAAYELSGMSSDDQREALTAYIDTGELSFKAVKDMKETKAAEREAAQIEGQMKITESGELIEKAAAGYFVESGYSAEEALEVVQRFEKAAGQQVSESDTQEDEAETVDNEAAGQEYQTPHPEGITSLCYSCQKYSDCNVKTGTCTSCDQYVNKAEAEKTEGQRYSDEQDAIDRETRQKLHEKAEQTKMENLPSDAKESKEKKYIRVAISIFKKIIDGEQQYLILKNDSYSIGEEITISEFAEGRSTGRMLEMRISSMDDDNTTSALVEGFCIVNVQFRQED